MRWDVLVYQTSVDVKRVSDTGVMLGDMAVFIRILSFRIYLACQFMLQGSCFQLS